MPPKKRIDTDAKAKLKPYIEAFRDWVMAIGPMLPIHEWTYEKELRDTALIWFDDSGIPRPRNTWSLRIMFDTKRSRQIITDDTHPMRLQLAYLALTHGELLRECEDENDVKRVKAAFNSWINKQLGLVKEVKG